MLKRRQGGESVIADFRQPEERCTEGRSNLSSVLGQEAMAPKLQMQKAFP